MLVAITGKAGAGKDTAAEALIRGLGFSPTAFAEPLKESCMFKFGLSHDDVFTQEGKKRFVPEWNKTVGEILQKEGTEATKSFWGPDFWVRRWDMTRKSFIEAGQPDLVITDCRFDEEAEFIIALGGIVIRITRADAPALEGRDPNHASERGIKESLIYASLENDGSIAELRSKLINVVNGWQANG